MPKKNVQYYIAELNDIITKLDQAKQSLNTKLSSVTAKQEIIDNTDFEQKKIREILERIKNL